jgi:putative serine protease PepD
VSTENEGAAVPPAPTTPPAPVAAPAAPASQEPTAPEGGAPTTPLPQVPQNAPDAPEREAATRDEQTHAYAAPAAHGSQAGHNGAEADPNGTQSASSNGTQPYAAPQASAPQASAPQASAPQSSWPPPPPPATPSYADSGAPGAPGTGGAGDGAVGGAGGAGGAGGGWGATYQQPAPKSGRGRGGLLAAVLIAALVAGGLGGGIGYTLAKNDDSSSTTVSAADSGGSVKRDPGTVAGVAARALPSTVTIEAESSSGEGGTGTGFVFDKQGHILTNNHVVADAVDGGKLTATFPNGKNYDAEVVGHAQGYDVAVIKLKNAPLTDLRPLTLGDSDKVAVGDSTIAIGAPFGLSNTVTTGIVSAKNRPVASSDGTSSNASYMSALQTDASINPGNSGGPLLDAQGNVIGINSAIQSAANGLGGTSQSGSIGLGFAIPINQAEYVAQQLIKTGKPVYAKIGASVALGDSTEGAKIITQGAGGSDPVESGGPADKAGLKPGDVITKLDDTVIDSGPTLIGEIWTHKPGDKVKITYERGGQTHTVDVTLGSRTGDS